MMRRCEIRKTYQVLHALGARAVIPDVRSPIPTDGFFRIELRLGEDLVMTGTADM